MVCYAKAGPENKYYSLVLFPMYQVVSCTKVAIPKSFTESIAGLGIGCGTYQSEVAERWVKKYPCGRNSVRI